MSIEGPAALGGHRHINKVRLTDLADAAGCSVATVSRALHDSPLISRATKTRILQVARTQGYHIAYDAADDLPSAQPRLAIMIGAQSSRGPVLKGQILQGRDSPTAPGLPYVLGPLLGGLVGASLHSPCNLQISHLPEAGFSLEAILSDVDADGYLFFGNSDLRDALDRHVEKSARTSDARLLFWGEASPGQRFDSIGPDNFAIGTTAVTHLAGAGCRRIAYLGETQGQDMGRRFMGYLTALNAADLRFESDLILSTPDEACHAAGRFDGLFVAGEGLYVAALEGLRRAGRSTPADLRVVGYYNEASTFPMETVSIDPVEAARRILVRLFGGRLETGAAFEKLPVTLRALPFV